MPIIEGKRQKTTKVFDAFIHLSGPLRIAWDVLLSAEQNRALALLCERLGYFGAESIVEAKALLVETQFEPNARPLPEKPIPTEPRSTEPETPTVSRGISPGSDGVRSRSPARRGPSRPVKAEPQRVEIVLQVAPAEPLRLPSSTSQPKRPSSPSMGDFQARGLERGLVRA